MPTPEIPNGQGDVKLSRDEAQAAAPRTRALVEGMRLNRSGRNAARG